MPSVAMSHTATSRASNSRAADSRIGARISADLHQMLKRAAQIQGRSLTDFLIGAARESALRVIKEHDIVQLSRRDQEIVAQSLLSPPEANPALRRAMKTHDTLMRSA